MLNFFECLMRMLSRSVEVGGGGGKNSFEHKFNNIRFKLLKNEVQKYY